MNKHALVIGSQIEGLSGVENDTQRMRDALRDRGFEVDLRFGNTATREGILDGYDALIAKSAAGDTAVLYYSGHGVYAVNKDPADRLRIMQAIAPTDLRDGSDTDFRGITAWELSIKLAQLTAKTKNVTVILDCCHSSQMSRSEVARHAVARSLPHPVRMGFDRHLAELEREYGEIPLDPVGNPHAVRLVACGRTESAFEYLNPLGERSGVFTESLLDLMQAAGNAPISWAAIAAAIRERVMRRFPAQRPDVEGPAERQLFSLSIADRTGIVPITRSGEHFRIQAGRITGASVGDVYGVMPFGSRKYDDARTIAKVQIVEADPLVSIAVLDAWQNGHTELPGDAVAAPIVIATTVRPVTVIAPEAERAIIEQAINTRATLRVATPSESGSALATLRLADQRLTIEDPAGPLFPPTRYPAELDETIKNVANLGVAQGMRELVGEHDLSASEMEIAWGVVEHGQPRAMPEHGASLGLRDQIYVRIRNNSSEPRYAHIFNIGVRGKVTLLTKNLATTGIPLERGGRDFFYGERNGRLTGAPLSWPIGLSLNSLPRLDELYVFVTSQPISLQVMETEKKDDHNSHNNEVVQNYGAAAKGCKLRAMLAQILGGANKDLGAFEPVEGFFVKHMSYLLHPRKAALADTVTFQVDDNPMHQAAARSPGAWISGSDAVVPPPVGGNVMRSATTTATTMSAPGVISIRFGELVVEPPRPSAPSGVRPKMQSDIRPEMQPDIWPGMRSDIWIDALICTRSTNRTAAYTAYTMRYKGAKIGDRLSLGHPQIFEGPVRDFVDIYLWITRGATREHDLVDLFRRYANHPQFEDAVAALSTTANTPWITAIGASAALARIAYDLLFGIDRTAAGLYRTAFLASEGFGIGRHPAQHLHRAQDVSFSLVIDNASHTTR